MVKTTCVNQRYVCLEHYWMRQRHVDTSNEQSYHRRKAVRSDYELLLGKHCTGDWDNYKRKCIDKCIKYRMNRELNCYLEGFLTGHDRYKKYFHRFQLDESPDSSKCVALRVDPEQTLS